MAAAAILKAVDHFRFCDFELNMFSKSVYQISSKSDGNCPFYIIRFNQQSGGGGHLEN
jgi:hypothetical protein